jgi:hypothetical protein
MHSEVLDNISLEKQLKTKDSLLEYYIVLHYGYYGI